MSTCNGMMPKGWGSRAFSEQQDTEMALTFGKVNPSLGTIKIIILFVALQH